MLLVERIRSWKGQSISIDWNDTNLSMAAIDGPSTGSTEYLIDSSNHTGYAQTIVETTKNAAGVATKRIVYTYGTDEITQTTYLPLLNGGEGWGEGAMLTYSHDAHTSVRMLTDAAGAIAQVFTYAAYGELIAIHNRIAQAIGTVGATGLQSQALTSLLYNGEAFDSRVGQMYLRARWYDGHRFTTLDPYFGNSRDPLSYNKFRFVHGYPVMGIDPSGREFSVGGLLAGISIQSTIRNMHETAVMNAAMAGVSAYFAGHAGEDPYEAFLESFEQSMYDSATSTIPAARRDSVKRLSEMLGSVGTFLEKYLGWEVLEQLAEQAGFASPVKSGFFDRGSIAVGVASDTTRLARIIGSKAVELVQMIRSRNVAASQGRIFARNYDHLGVEHAKPYKQFTSGNNASSATPGLYLEANHLNQDAAFSKLGIKSGDGIAIPFVGSTNNGRLGSVGTPHYEFHWSLDTFWQPYRTGNLLHGNFPSLRQYDQALRQALKHAGYSRRQANELADLAKKDWKHLSPDTTFNYIPDRTIRGPHGYDPFNGSFFV